jgi:hypothetical protein
LYAALAWFFPRQLDTYVTRQGILKTLGIAC